MDKIAHLKHVALEVVKTLQNNGYMAFFAGGCVRDELLGREPKDYDVATDAYPEEVEALFPRTLPLGKAFGVIAIIDGSNTVEVATFREEVGTLDGRHPETIIFTAAKEDALRRDFTVNGLFYDPIKDQLHDYIDGRRDLEQRVIRAIGNPRERFQEDHLRMLRAIRFTYTLGFILDQTTEDAIREMASLITKISAERIEAELSRILTESQKPGDALEHLYRAGLLEHILPEVIPMVGQEQPPQLHPEGDVFQHTCLMLNLMAETAEEPPTRELAYSILLHDIGKPPTAKIGPGTDGIPRIRFDGHASVSAELAEMILTRLKFSNKEKTRILETVRGHMRFMDVQQMRQSTLRRMIGADTFDLEMELHRIDCLGSHAELNNYNFVKDYQEKLKNEPALPEPWVRGNDLLAMGIRDGKQIGRILKEAYDAQMEERFASPEELISWIESTYAP